jgi:POT family proton-dependent oligopeptide transporter
MEYHNKQPVDLYAFSFAEVWDRFSYYGIQALLVLYLTKAFLVPDDFAYSIYGAYTALAFGTTVAGGIIADRWLGSQKTAFLGALFLIMGNFLLVINNIHFAYFGLALLVCGTGMFKPSNTNLIGTLYTQNDTRREGGFAILYMAMNIGALSSPIIYGLLSQHYGWHYGFALSSLGMSIALCIICVRKIQKMEPQMSLISQFKNDFKKYRTALLLMLCASVVFVSLMLHPSLFKHLLEILGAVSFFGLIYVAFQYSPHERNTIFGLSVLVMMCLVFFACALQTATSLTIFIDRYVDRSFFGWKIPTMIFLSLEPLFIILTAPLMGKIWGYLSRKSREPSVTLKLAIGIGLVALSFAIFGFGANHNALLDNRMGLICIVIGNLTLGIGEICVLPVAMSAITSFAPVKMKATMVGILYLSLAFSGYLSSLIAKLIGSLGRGDISISYGQGFSQISIVAMVIAIFAILCAPFVNRLIATNS